jgi:class 3 adenylate cyclase
VVTDPNMPTSESRAAVIAFGDFSSYYAIRDMGGLHRDRSDEYRSATTTPSRSHSVGAVSATTRHSRLPSATSGSGWATPESRCWGGCSGVTRKPSSPSISSSTWRRRWKAGVRRRPPRGVAAAAIADLTGYTRLTEEAGDEAAAKVSLTLARLVNEIAASHQGEVVKMLGDGVFFHFRDPGDAVRASLDIVESVGPAGLPPAHVGVNAGPMIYDEGDYFGRTVNIAARIASRAAADQVFVSQDLVRSVTPTGFHVREVGPFELKGIARPVWIFEAVRDDAG